MRRERSGLIRRGECVGEEGMESMRQEGREWVNEEGKGCVSEEGRRWGGQTRRGGGGIGWMNSWHILPIAMHMHTVASVIYIL